MKIIENMSIQSPCFVEKASSFESGRERELMDGVVESLKAMIFPWASIAMDGVIFPATISGRPISVARIFAKAMV